VTLPSGGGVQMTVAHYTTPDLKPIKSGGIRPDVIVDLTALVLRDPETPNVLAPHGAPKKAEVKPADDLILQKALQLFNEPAAVKKAA
jgi:C-terminal processing protease CtpA/Prc